MSKARDAYIKWGRSMMYAENFPPAKYIEELQGLLNESIVDKDILKYSNMELIELLNTIKNDCLLPYEHSYYINQINKYTGGE